MRGKGVFSLKSSASALILIGLAVWAGVYLSGHLDEFKQALTWPLSCLVLVSLLTLIRFAVVGLFTQVILKAFGLRLTFKEWFGLPVMTTLGNYFLPLRGGAGLRAAYLKKRHDFALTDFLSSFLAIYLVVLMVNAVVGLTVLLFLKSWRGPGGMVVSLFCGCVLAGTILVTLFPLKTDWFERMGLGFMVRLIEGWQKIREHPGVVAKLFLLSAANTFTGVLVIWVGFIAMDVSAGPAGAALVVAFQALTLFMSITPGGLGIQEAVLVFTAQAVGVSPAQGLALAVAVRAVTLFWTLLLGPIFSYLLFKKPGPATPKEPSH